MRISVNDPRTIARDIPGIFDVLFPQLAQGVVASFNRRALSLDGCTPVSQDLVDASKVQRAMLFEVAVAAGEQLIGGNRAINWDSCLSTALARQREHFDAQLPQTLANADKQVALQVAENLVAMLAYIQAAGGGGQNLIHAPRIPGYQWVASGVGDFSIGTMLIEVKCTNRRFSSPDYRQILMYWLLSYCAAIEGTGVEWSEGILLNPRLNLLVRLSFNEIIGVVGAGRSKVELIELFSSSLGTRLPLAMG
ncbi:hypothetical protein [Bradyrhizobium cenepequi]|uniref:hypothetical protein n=1 Tax=Bradyrhizobium cenepequi TaxID=2821403 RepID=UPI001CE3AAEB|nr:hypothetical protein [Bradyrhizobium cenepequi]MCA6111944.1 hypothetical protein [Bradyrhizobium cenepequi]